MEEKEKVQELAETLKGRGLAASMADAIDKAKNIIYGIANKKEEPKVEEQTPYKKEESSEITNTNVDESNVIEKDTSEEIKEVEKDASSIKIKEDQDQQKLDGINIENEDYDFSKEEKTVNEMLNEEKEEEVFVSSHESDDLLKEESNVPSTEQTPETITTIEGSDSEESPMKIEEIPEKKEDTEQNHSVEEKDNSKLTEEEKKKTDLSEIFNFGKR